MVCLTHGPGTRDVRLLTARDLLQRSGLSTQVHQRAQQGRSLRIQIDAKKGQGSKAAAKRGMPQAPPVPPVDWEAAELVIFVQGDNRPQWFPVSIIKGGAALDSLLKGCQDEWGKRLYGKTLIRNVAGSLYKQRDELEEEVRKQEMFRWCKSFKYGFKVRDKSRPGAWFQPDNITVLPPEQDLEPTVIERLSQWTSRFRGS